MRFKYYKTGVLLISILLLVLITPNAFAGNYDRSYSSQVQFGLVNNELHVSVPSSLYDYYSGKTIKLADDNAYSTLVTPDAVEPIAESLRNLSCGNPRSDEEFANAVLMLVHQIPYADGDVKYPIETIVENAGKCDTLSLLAASIMKAGGLDVVLLYFKGVHHINVGVYLPYEPHGTWWWLSPTGYESNGKKYWIAECTPAMDWKVGDVPPLLTDENAWIISLENSEKSSPAHVSSQFSSPLNSSSISINLSSDTPDISGEVQAFTISGSISPAYPNETVTVYFSQDGISYSAYKTEADNWGNYSFRWTLNATGTYYIRTSWSGNADCAGADSEPLTVFLGFPQSLFQFKVPGYYYTYSPTHLVSNELRVRQGVEDFLDVQLSGTGVLLTGEFIILRDKQNTSSIQTQKITIPASKKVLRLGGNRWATVQVPERTIMISVSVPEGMHQVRLPENFDLTMNNKFGFILRNDVGDNYSVSVRGMADSDIAQINQPNGNGTVFMNAFASIKDNTWYKVVARISENETTATIYDVNGTLLDSTPIAHDKRYISDLVILIADNTEKAVAFKNLNIETLSQTTQPIEGTKKAATESELLVPNVALAILLVTVFAVGVYVKKRKKV
jgi:hypothetical protein